MELSWRNGLQDFAMPYLIQVARQTLNKLKVLEEADENRSSKEAARAKQGEFFLMIDAVDLATGMAAPLMLTYGTASPAPGYPIQTPAINPAMMQPQYFQ